MFIPLRLGQTEKMYRLTLVYEKDFDFELFINSKDSARQLTDTQNQNKQIFISNKL